MQLTDGHTTITLVPGHTEDVIHDKAGVQHHVFDQYVQVTILYPDGETETQKMGASSLWLWNTLGHIIHHPNWDVVTLPKKPHFPL